MLSLLYCVQTYHPSLTCVVAAVSQVELECFEASSQSSQNSENEITYDHELPTLEPDILRHHKQSDHEHQDHQHEKDQPTQEPRHEELPLPSQSYQEKQTDEAQIEEAQHEEDQHEEESQEEGQEDHPQCKKRKTKNERNVMGREGGYVSKSRKLYREEGGATVGGTKRTCLADACMALMGHNNSYESQKFRDKLEATIKSGMLDPVVKDASKLLEVMYKHTITAVTKHFMAKKGGLNYQLINASPAKYLLRLRVTDRPNDNDPDWHFVAYNGRDLINNFGKIYQVEPADKENDYLARQFFRASYWDEPDLTVRITQIYELRPIS